MNTITSSLPLGLTDRGLQDMGLCTHLPTLADMLHSNAGLLDDFSADELRAIGSVMCRVHAVAGQVLIEEGERSEWMLLVLSGTVDVTKRVMRLDALGQPTDTLLETTRLAVVRAGATLGEMSLFDSEPRYATCTAIEDVSGGVLTRSAIGQLIKQHPTVSAKLMVRITQVLAQRLRSTSAKLTRAVAERKQQDLLQA